MKNEKKDIHSYRKILIFSILFLNVSHAKYSDIKEETDTYEILDVMDNEYIKEQKDLNKINEIRQQLIYDMENPIQVYNRHPVDNQQILRDFNVEIDFLNNNTFKKEIQRQKRSKEIILRNLFKGQKKAIIANINKILQSDKDIPDYMIYLAMNESNFNQHALSQTKARGVWQFMPRTARNYNLVVDRKRDDRINVHKSTNAAVNYLKDMNRFFDSWKLSIMAYNTGPGNVIRSFVYNGILNKCSALGSACNNDKSIKMDSDKLLRYDLYKSKKNFQALEKLFKKYQNTKYEPTLAQMLEMKKKKKQYLPKETRNYIRRILASCIIYKNELTNIGGKPSVQEKETCTVYTVKPGDTLSNIALKFKTDYKKIIQDNNLKNTHITVNQKLKIF